MYLIVYYKLLESFKKYPYRQITPQVEEVSSTPSATRAVASSDSRPVQPSNKSGTISAPIPSSSQSTSPLSTTSPSDSVHPPVPPQLKAKSPVIQLTDTGKQVPIGNGGYTENYYWTQTLNEITVYVDVPIGTRGKQVECEMKPRSLSLAVKGQDGGPLLRGSLEDVVRLDESMWTVAADDNSTQV
jgi:hypothetical protein